MGKRWAPKSAEETRSPRRRKRSREEDYLTALHEASHVIAAIEFDFAYGTVTIERDLREDTEGCAIVGCPLIDWQRGDGPRRPVFDKYVIGLFAGSAAEAYHRGRRLVTVGIDDLGSADREKAKAEMERFGMYPPHCRFPYDDVYCAYEKKMCQKALRLVKKRFERIKVLAAALLERRTLQRHEIDEVLGSAP